MRIERATDMEEVVKCLPWEQEIRNKGRDRSKVSDMLHLVKIMIDNPLFGFWIAYDDEDNMIGYIVLLINLIPGFKSVNLVRMYAKEKEVFQAFEEIGREFAKQFGVKKFVVTAIKNIKAIQRRHGLKVVSVNMEKEL